MPDYAIDLRNTVERAASLLLNIQPEAARASEPHKWAPCQIIGHLIDSACNNHRRFILGQLQEDLTFPGYAQEEWVEVQRYHEAPWEELVLLWKFYNLHLARVMEAAPEVVRTKTRHQHSLDKIAWKTVPEEATTSLDYLMSDYVGHLKNHLRQILGSDWDKVTLF